VAQGTQPSMQALRSAELAPIVAHVIDNPDIDLLDWRVQPISVTSGSQGAGGLGLFRLSGSATAAGQVYPWSVIVKAFSGSKPDGDPTGTSQIPSAWNYWKREILAVIRYQSRLEISVCGAKSQLKRYWHTDSYEKQSGCWQVVWSQATEMQ
jgi:hypothetical protein